MSNNANLVELLEELLAFRTISGDIAAAEKCVDHLHDYLNTRGMIVRRLESNGIPSIIATSRPTNRPKVTLQAHLDVVPCADTLHTLIEKDGKLFGRGVYDMKFAGAVFLKLVDELQNQLKQYDLGLMLTFDEEIGGRDGVGFLLKDGYRTEVCILPDAGDNWHLEVTQKGLWILKLKAKGVAVHGSRPWEGESAIERLLDALPEIQKMFGDQHAESDTLSINQISGGSAVNQVADYAETTLDIRFMDEENYKKIKSNMKAIADKHQLELETFACIHPVKTDLNHPKVAAFLEVAEQLRGAPLGLINSLGNSDAHYFAEHDIPVILLRPEGGAPHSETEWIDRAGLEEYYELIRAYVEAEARF